MAPGHMGRSNPKKTIWWFLGYIDSPGKIAKLNFKTVKYMEHPGVRSEDLVLLTSVHSR